MNNQLNIGDKIGFTFLASDIDGADKTLYFPVVEITEIGGESAYIVEFPDGTRTKSPVPHSSLPYRGVQMEPAKTSTDKMICLSDRKDEFKKAMRRGLDNDLRVETDFEKDWFLVVNRTNYTDYRVKLETRADGKVYGFCECKDFEFRKRICKHQTEVLQDAFFGVCESFGTVLR